MFYYAAMLICSITEEFTAIIYRFTEWAVTFLYVLRGVTMQYMLGVYITSFCACSASFHCMQII